MNRLRNLSFLVRPQSLHPIHPQPKRTDGYYLTHEHRAWRDAVLARAGWRCEAVDALGMRCERAAPEHRLFADHVHEIRDGGSRLDPCNGRALCSAHHVLKTNRMRAERWK